MYQHIMSNRNYFVLWFFFKKLFIKKKNTTGNLAYINNSNMTSKKNVIFSKKYLCITIIKRLIYALMFFWGKVRAISREQ